MSISARARALVRCSLVAGSLLGLPFAGWAQEAGDQKSIRMTCGTCPDGYATTGTTQAPSVCKDGDPTLVECVPLGANILPVCGSCPEGYREIGRSSVPSRCGSRDGGRLSQCQLERMESNFPDSTTGGKICPPDCGSTATPGEGPLPPPPKHQYIPPAEKK